MWVSLPWVSAEVTTTGPETGGRTKRTELWRGESPLWFPELPGPRLCPVCGPSPRTAHMVCPPGLPALLPHQPHAGPSLSSLTSRPSQVILHPVSISALLRVCGSQGTHVHLASRSCGGHRGQGHPPRGLCGQSPPNSQRLFSLISSLWQEKATAPPLK